MFVINLAYFFDGLAVSCDKYSDIAINLASISTPPFK